MLGLGASAAKPLSAAPLIPQRSPCPGACTEPAPGPVPTPVPVPAPASAAVAVATAAGASTVITRALTTNGPCAGTRTTCPSNFLHHPQTQPQTQTQTQTQTLTRQTHSSRAQSFHPISPFDLSTSPSPSFLLSIHSKSKTSPSTAYFLQPSEASLSHRGTPTKPAATPTATTTTAAAAAPVQAPAPPAPPAPPAAAGLSHSGHYQHHLILAHDQLERRSLLPLALAAASHFASTRRRPPSPLSLPSEDLANSVTITITTTASADDLETSVQSLRLESRPRRGPAQHRKPADAFANPRLTTLSHQPVYPGASTPTTTFPLPPAPAPTAHRRFESTRRAAYIPREPFIQSPFLNKTSTTPRRLRRLSGAARLWNPTNSTPRRPSESNPRRRRPSTPPPANVPLSHPALDHSTDPTDPVSTGAGHYPLLTLSEQRQSRLSGSGRASLQVDRGGSNDHRISLPRSVRHSYDEKRGTSSNPSPVEPEAGPSSQPRVTGLRQRGQSVSRPNVDEASSDSTPPPQLDKGKGKAIMTPQPDEQQRGYSRDLERGPDVMDPRRHSNLSAGDGIGSAMSSDSSIMGEEVGDMGEEWGPQHPCFPHLNPHVPVDSAEYQNTRIIRVRRDWLIEGDLAPTFSNLYPEILDPAGLSEQEFRRVIEKLNGELVPIFNPYDWRNIVDSMLGLVTGWLWDDFGLTGVKARLTRLENWMDQWNKETEKTAGTYEGASAPKLIPLRRTGYMTLDIQISDPEVAAAPSTPGASATGVMPMEPPAAVTN